MVESPNGTRIREKIDINTDAEGNITNNTRFPYDTNLPIRIHDEENNRLDEKNNINVVKDGEKEITIEGLINHYETFNNLLDQNLTVEYYVRPEVNPHIVDFDDVAEPVTFIDNDGAPGELFPDGTDENHKVELSYFPYVDFNEVNSRFVDPQLFEDENLKSYNPNNYRYNPNFNLDSQGYRPIVVEMEGRARCYNVENDSTELVDGKFHNDNKGVPYSFNYVDRGDRDSLEQINRQNDMTENNIVKPHFYNTTDYTHGENIGLTDYDVTDNPVFEYMQEGKKLFFNDNLGDVGSDNHGEIRVYYNYLVEGIRVMAIMRRISKNIDITPALYDYEIKTRDFHL